MHAQALRYLTAICLVAGAVFSLGITGDHISMDDWGYIYGCPFVRNGLSLENLRLSFTEIGYDAFWMPFTFFTYMCDITLLGGGWIVHHAVNVAIHVLNAALVFLFLRDVLLATTESSDRRATVLSALATLLWAVHPMRAEAVTYVASRKELLWSLFALIGLRSWMKFLVDRKTVRYVAAIACCILACLSKPTAVCFPILAYLLETMVNRSFRPKRLWCYAPFLLVAGIVGGIVLYAQGHPIGIERLDVFGESFFWRLLNACVGFGMHLWHAVLPSLVYFDYRAVFGGRPLNLVSGLSVLALSAACFAAALRGCWSDKGRRYGLIGMFVWYFIALMPVSGILGTVNGDHAYADRYTYLPFVGVMAIVMMLAANLRSVGMKVLSSVIAIAVIVELVPAPAVIGSFRNDFTAFSRTLRFDPDHWRALRVVGNEYCARLGKMDEGVRMLERSIALHSSMRTAESLAYVLSVRGAPGDFERVRELGAGVVHNPARDRHGMMLDALGTASLREGKDADAVRFYYASLKAPDRNYSNHHSMLNLSLALANCGRYREAEGLLRNLAKSSAPGVGSCCKRILAEMNSREGRRFAWQADPFGNPDDTAR